MKLVLEKWINYWELVWSFTWRNIQVKYKQTFFGFLWALFMPLVIVFAGIIMKVIMARLYGHSIEPSQISSITVKALPWAFFIGALKFSVNSLVANMAVIKKIRFPRVIFPLSYTFSQLFDFIVGVTAFIFIFIFLKIGVSIHLLWAPFLVIYLILLTCGLGMIFSAGNLFYRDVRHIIDVALMFAIFFVPVFYDSHLFGKWEFFVLLNPVSSILECLNTTVILHKAPPLGWFLYAGASSLLTFWGGWVIFHKAEPFFAEYI
jgi:ABC-type polysaccharide/polyol phosphate export permease